jgi:dihydropteroate synthase
MGVLNVTPDSFSDGGLYDTFEHALAHGIAMAVDGADVIDVGGESSRPGAEPVPTAVELERVIPVIDALATAPELTTRGVRISVDTTKPVVATAAVAAGATLINDISASLYEVAAATGAGWVAMHMQGEPRTMQDHPHYGDVVDEVTAFVLERARLAHDAGVEEVWIDPGIGFGKAIDHNLSLLRHLGDLVAAAEDADCAGVVVGTSRKRFLGVLAAAPGDPAAPPAPPVDRLPGSIATAAAALIAGTRMVRVHDVAATVQLTRLYGPAA